MNDAEAKELPGRPKGTPRCLSSSQTTLQLAVLFEGRERTLRQQALAKLLQASLKQLYGVIGGAVAFDILSYDEMSASARIQVNSRDELKLKTAAAVVSSHQGTPCLIQVRPTLPLS
ncbi:hypothetical protein WJX84_010275 [Apatococcus fuscideae]|uniref:Ribonucleases P/MRP subunit Pop8-like domain-containing protein n=1 Tax=Apatococcus fuscideae TaxID=2026836 RepID=A0AAW1SY67_9CHLO